MTGRLDFFVQYLAIFNDEKCPLAKKLNSALNCAKLIPQKHIKKLAKD